MKITTFHATMTNLVLSNQSLKSLLTSCKTIKQALQIHAQIVVNGIHHDPFLITPLISFFAFSNSSSALHHSSLLFSQITTPDLFLYNAMIKAHSQSHAPHHALSFYKSMLSSRTYPDSFTFPYLLKSCVRLFCLKLGIQVHCHVVKNGFESNIFVLNSLLNLYCVFRDMRHASMVFDESPVRDLVSYNTLINGFVEAGFASCSTRFFGEMRGFCVQPDGYTFVALLSACSSLEDCETGKKVHCLAYKLPDSLGSNALLMNALVDMYAKCGCLEMARRVLMSGIRSGKSVVAAWTSVLSAYAQRGEVDVARRIFDQMEERDVVSWTAMINCYSFAGHFEEALELFVQLEDLGMEADVVAVVAALSACARLGALESGRRIHHKYAGKNWPCDQNGGFISAAVDMYAKCGSIDSALDIFCKTSDHLKTTLLYNSIISGLAHHGLGESAISLFKEMEILGLRPDEITFIALLCACGHSGLVDDGKKLFESMLTVYGISPQMEHYGCMVDLLGRAGCLDEAHCLILAMPFKANAVIWRALLSACKIHGDIDMAKIASKELLTVEHDHGARNVMMSNMLAGIDQHDEAASVREAIDNVGIRKPPGWSYVETNGALHKFLAGDNSHPEAKATEMMLLDVSRRLKSIGHVISA
ncbi:putative tetratricopeptide-like helical domain-containing protein [Lupinus albus]|uniref:Putative tetratricopeptide-like helical domain-containing protein n=1 Tax=Lupinus albus TaxID=3870 RepID=A0A6A4QFT0_LUPAL|nr:putative tetratricopeptide-like helical domain-containing protein [Lupinus albus]